MKKTIGYIATGLIIVVMMTAIIGCGKEDIKYGDEIGTVVGNVDLSKDEPSITISNIKSYVGDEIDFLSGVIVANEEEYPDLQTWVDASTVDIFTPGDYTATYTFKYDGKENHKDIIVTIINKDKLADDISTDNNQSSAIADNNNNNNNNNNNSSDVTTSQNNVQLPDTTLENNQNTTSESHANENPTSGPTSNENPTSGSTTHNPTSTPAATSATTTHRVMVTSAASSTTANKEIGYSSIELLSGKTVKIKVTTAKYIVSTHTDISYTTKNGTRYKVSKLIVTYNTGSTQVLETAEEKVD